MHDHKWTSTSVRIKGIRVEYFCPQYPSIPHGVRCGSQLIEAVGISVTSTTETDALINPTRYIVWRNHTLSRAKEDRVWSAYNYLYRGDYLIAEKWSGQNLTSRTGPAAPAIASTTCAERRQFICNTAGNVRAQCAKLAQAQRYTV